jgi:hypothetical protein
VENDGGLNGVYSSNGFGHEHPLDKVGESAPENSLTTRLRRGFNLQKKSVKISKATLKNFIFHEFFAMV